MDHILRDGNSSETTNVDDIMHTAVVDAAVATASLNGTLGVAEVLHVQLLEERSICVIKQRIDLLPAWKKTKYAWLVHTVLQDGVWHDDFQPYPSLEKSPFRWKWQCARLPKKKKTD